VSIFTNPAESGASHAGAYVAAVLSLLGDRDAVDVLRQTPGTLAGVLADHAKERIAAPEAPGKWSVSEVVMHLADSELVWGYRLRRVLSEERPAITGYDQDAWAGALHYSKGDAAEALGRFRAIRASNLRLLESASPEALRRVGVHAERGEESVEHMIKLYAGHDLVHLRQIDRILAGGGDR